MDAPLLLPLIGTVVRQLLALAVLAAAAASVGWLAIHRLPLRRRREALAVATIAGLGLLGTALFFVGLAGGLRRWVMVLLAAAALAALPALVRGMRRWPRAASAGVPPPEAAAAFDPRPRTAAAALALGLLPTFWWGLFPPTGFDVTTYHLPYVQAFVATHRLALVPEVIFPIFPQLGEVLFAALVLVTGADVTTHVVQLLALVAGAVLLDAAGRRFFSPAAGLWAAALWLAHPLAHYQAASAYVDLLMALFAVLAVVAWEAWREGRLAGERHAGGWLVLSGAAAGLAMAVKYLGMVWLAALGVVGLGGAPRRRRLVSAAVVGLVALAVALPWYARIHHETGNPIHPFLASLFETSERPSRFDAILGLDRESTTGEGVAAVARGAGRALAQPGRLVQFAWRATFDRGWFDRQAPLAPWYFVLAPLAAVFCLRDRRLLRWLLLVVVYALLWTTHDPRYQLPSMGVLALAGAGGLHHLGERVPALGRLLGRPAAAWALAAVLALPGPAYAVYKVFRHGPVPAVTPAARQVFLDREVPGHEAVRRLDGLHGGGSTLFALGGQNLTYYSEGRLLGHSLGPWREGRVLPLLGRPAALHRELRSMGVDYLLVVRERRPAPLRGPAFERLFRPVPTGDARVELWALAGATATSRAHRVRDAVRANPSGKSLPSSSMQVTSETGASSE
jgi:hypothetical protein